eukprot:SAG22_NODE_6037_length_911_cov_0.983990_1_plen_26_part_10
MLAAGSPEARKLAGGRTAWGRRWGVA